MHYKNSLVVTDKLNQGDFMKALSLVFFLATSSLFAIEMSPKTELKNLCDVSSQWFVTAHTSDNSIMNGNSSCVQNWSYKIMVTMGSFCQEKQNIFSPYYSCRVLENGKVIKDWDMCYNGWSFDATDSCGKYDIEVFARGRVGGRIDNEIESPLVKTSVEFYAD